VRQLFSFSGVFFNVLARHIVSVIHFSGIFGKTLRVRVAEMRR
jgi:hypothetical protein